MSAPQRDPNSPLVAWSTRAINLPEHATNPIHTDEGGRAAGFPGALVAGVTSYVYLTHPAVVGWGLDWVDRGSAHVRFLAPVLEGDLVDCTPVPSADGIRIDAQVAAETRATCAVSLAHTDPLPVAPRLGEDLDPISVPLSSSWHSYAARAGDSLELLTDHGIVHPVIWPVLANEIVHHQLARGPWVHTRSRIQHHGRAAVATTVEVTATVIDRYMTRAGERAVVDVRVQHDGRLLAAIEHEALIALT